MASYANLSKQASASSLISMNQVSVLAQAKPVIISSTTPQASEYSSLKAPACAPSTGVLSEKLNATLKFSQDYHETSKDLWAKFNSFEQHNKQARHIEDESVISRQNAANQMRQNAVQAAVASQQKVVRLSATERLALTAKRPQPMNQTAANNQQLNCQRPLPTLETLLAVQRQLQHHTQQHLNAAQMVTSQSQSQMQSQMQSQSQRNNKPLPPSPPANSMSYEKELPPLPESYASSSSNEDESQMNSLDSQSSPGNSLVSIPPPPPPLSSYLEQYEVEPETAANSSAKSFPMPSVKASAMLNYQFNRTTSFDEVDGGIRFPTPPPPADLTLSEEEEDGDFECKIPTPPLYKSMLPQQSFNSSTFSAAKIKPPPLFRQPNQQPQPTLTVQINANEQLPANFLSAPANQSNVNHGSHIMMPASSSSPSSSSDGDAHSSNSSSSTSGIHSSIDSPSSSNSKLDDFNYTFKVCSSSSSGNFKALKPLSAAFAPQARRPALKQKKSVSFSDKVELVACAEEQTEDHLPNPLLARVLAGKLQ